MGDIDLMYHHKNCMKLRKVNRSDLPKLFELKCESWWGTHTTPIINMDDQVRWYESIPENMLCMIIEQGQNSAAVYLITDISHLNRSAKISGSVFKSHRRSDIIKDCCAAGVDFAFEILNLHRLEAEVLECNHAAQQYEVDYLEFKIEGRRRQAVYKCGRYYDSLIIGLLREEWERQDRVKSYGGSCNRIFDHDKADKLIDRSNKFIQKETN